MCTTAVGLDILRITSLLPLQGEIEASANPRACRIFREFAGKLDARGHPASYDDVYCCPRACVWYELFLRAGRYLLDSISARVCVYGSAGKKNWRTCCCLMQARK